MYYLLFLPCVVTVSIFQILCSFWSIFQVILVNALRCSEFFTLHRPSWWSLKTARVSPSHLMKAYCPILVTCAPIVTSRRFQHASKAELPISVALSGIVMSVSPLQPSNELLRIRRTPAPIVTLVNCLHPEKAWSSTGSTVALWAVSCEDCTVGYRYVRSCACIFCRDLHFGESLFVLW